MGSRRLYRSAELRFRSAARPAHQGRHQDPRPYGRRDPRRRIRRGSC